MANRIAALLFLVFAAAACRSDPGVVYDNVMYGGVAFPARSFSEAQDKDWLLVEVWLNGVNTGFDRGQFAAEPRADIRPFFTLRFDAERIGGTGAPNHFGGPYSLADDQTIAVGLMVSTMMAPLLEPGNLKEHEYLSYLQNAYRWNLADEKLELYSKSDSGAEAVLIFIP